MITAKLYGGAVTVTLDSSIDKPGKVRFEGPPELAVDARYVLKWAFGFQGHSLGSLDSATPRDLHAALIGLKRTLHVKDLTIDDFAPLPELPPGCVY